MFKRVLKQLPVVAILIAALAASALAQTPGGSLVIGRPSDAISLDPHRATTAPEVWVYNNIYETLVLLDEDMNIQPALAVSWELVEEDRMRFYLKEGVSFHDGTPFNAEAVEFTINRAVNPEFPARGVAWLGPVIGAEAVDEYTVDVLTDGPFGPLLNHLSMVFVVGIVSPTAVELHGDDYGRHPVGTGPFKFDNWVTNQSITLVRNDDYHGEPALLDQVEFRVIPEEGARMLSFYRGDLDMLLRAAPAELPMLRDDPSVTVHDADGLRVFYLGFNTAQAPTDDPVLRRAIAHLVDVDSINAFIVEDAMVPARSVIAPAVFGFRDTGMPELYAYDPEKAEELLSEAGYTRDANGKLVDADGAPLTLVYWASEGRDMKDREVSEAILAQLTQAGVTVDFIQREWGAYLDAHASDDNSYNLFMMGWVTMTGDAEFGMYSTFHSTDVNTNYAHYNNTEVDRLLDLARGSLDQEERAAAYGDALELITADTVWKPIYQTRETVVVHDYVKGYVSHPAEYYVRLNTVWLDR